MTKKMELGLVDLNHLLPTPVLFWLGHPRTICGAHVQYVLYLYRLSAQLCKKRHIITYN
jgi:hypothetical protein